MEKNENFKSELETQYGILIEASEKTKKQRYIFLLVIIFITFISVLVNIFFSYNALKNSKNINSEVEDNIKTYYQTLSTVYGKGNELNLNNIVTGFSLGEPKIIQITNEGDKEITFNIKISSIKTNLMSTNNLVYTLTRENEIVTTNILPLQEKAIMSEIKIEPKETINYSISVAFNGVLEQGTTENYYQANIVIEQNNNKPDLLE